MSRIHVAARHPVGVVCTAALLVCRAGAQSGAEPSRLERAIARAEVAMREGDNGKAIAILAAVDYDGTDPRARRLLLRGHLERGSARWKAGDAELAFDDFHAADRLRPGDEGILQSLGVATFRLHRDRDSESYMKKVLALNPDNVQALTVLGQIAARRDDNATATTYLERAARLGRRSDVVDLAAKLGKEAAVEKDFTTTVRGDLRISYPPGETAGVEKALPEVQAILSQAATEIESLLGARPAGRVWIVLYNAEQFRRVTHAHAWARAYFDGKVRVAVQAWPEGRTELRRDLRHELTHAFLHDRFPKVPAWLHEGLAQRIEGRSAGPIAGRFRTGQWKPMPAATFTGRFVADADAAQAAIAYAQALMLVCHLERLGRDRLRSLLFEFEHGLDTEAALRAIHHKGLDELLLASMR